jgi:hypothetical protein
MVCIRKERGGARGEREGCADGRERVADVGHDANLAFRGQSFPTGLKIIFFMFRRKDGRSDRAVRPLRFPFQNLISWHPYSPLPYIIYLFA